MTLAIISHPDCALHEAGEQHPECPARVEVIDAALKRYAFHGPVNFLEAPLATYDQLIQVHDKSYVDWIFSIAPKEETIMIDADTGMNPATLNAALRAAGSVPYAVDWVRQDRSNIAFCNVRPPGHHAEGDKAMGFCFFNNVAVGVKYAIKQYQLQRIAVIDFDVHHGNGTQAIFQTDKRVMYCSAFQHPFYPGYDDELDNDHILSIPLPVNTQGETFRERIRSHWLKKIADFQPQLFFFSAGFDAHRDDPLADLNLVEADYVWLTREVATIAKQLDARMISVLEGGYNLAVLASCVPAHVNAMMVDETPT